MKTLAVLVAALTLSGCSTYQTHLKTGCVWSCAEWQNRESQATAYTSGYSQYNPGITASQVILPSGGYMVIRSGNLTTVTQTSTTRR
jgi:hypothetical protein